MTVSTEVNQAAYTGNGVTTVFPYTFRILNDSNLTVTRIDLQEVETVLTLGTDYTVTGAGTYNGGAVTLPQPLPAGYSIVIERDLAIVQETDLRNQGTFFAEVHEDAFDYLTMIIQQVASWFGLALRRPTIKSKFYDAKQFRIANLADPINQQDAVNNRTMVSYVDKMIAGITGGYGWFLQTGFGAVYRTFQDKMRDRVDARDFGLKADGLSNDTTSLKNAITSAFNNKISEVSLPTGQIIITETINIPPGITLVGEGIDYWDTYRPAPDRLLKSWSKGTHLVFKGTGTKSDSIRNLMNARTAKTVGGIAFPFTDFTNNDSVNGAPATAKPFSVAVKATHASQIKNLRIMLNNNGITGYNDAGSLSLGDEWDVGLWVYDGSQAVVDTVQVVGYWRIAGTLVTENDGTYTMVGNPECMTFNNVMTQGRRGLLIRNAAQVDVYSHTDTTATCLYNSSFTLTADMKFKTLGSAQVYTFSGYSVAGNQITLTGISPNLPANTPVLRAANIGNNFSGTVFSNFKACSLEHTSGNNSASLGLGEAGAMEIDGYPIRNLKFINFKAQTTFDRLNTLYGDMRDAKLISCEHENGVMIAYSNSETIGYTTNIRFINSDIQSSTDTSAFTPRDCFIDYKQIPTQNTDGSFILKNWRDNDISIQSFSGVKLFNYRSSDFGSELTNGASFRYLWSNGATNETIIYGKNISIKNSAGLNYLQMFDGSLSAAFAGAVTATGGVIVGSNVRPTVANADTVGTSAFPFSGGFTQTAYTVTSDEEEKTRPSDLSDSILDAWAEVEFCQYQYIDRVIVKGDDGARWHFGVVAQRAEEAFARHGLDVSQFGFFCKNTEEEVQEERDENGVVTQQYHPAFTKRGIRYEEALILEAALQRRNYVAINGRLEKLENQ
jgi:hypothetical protein